MTGAAAARLSDGRLHFHHGPIDLVIEAVGSEAEVAAAYRQAWVAFRPVLEDLVTVLPTLRAPVTDLITAGIAAPPPMVGQGPQPGASLPPCGGERERGRDCRGDRLAPPPPSRAIHPVLSPVAAAMLAAAARHAPAFVTPMAAVAGAVADHVLAAMTAGRMLDRAYVNNGGDVALWLSPGTGITAAGGPALADRICITDDSPVRGIATSGWRGRSHSLGIADAVTVLARTAAGADVAATLIANAVDLPGHAAITRRPARELAPDSDLRDLPVTVAVDPLTAGEVARALAAGRAAAEAMRRAGLIEGAALWLGGETVTVGDPAVLAAAAAGPA